jgi:hypothetical protein
MSGVAEIGFVCAFDVRKTLTDKDKLGSFRKNRFLNPSPDAERRIASGHTSSQNAAHCFPRPAQRLQNPDLQIQAMVTLSQLPPRADKSWHLSPTEQSERAPLE